MQASLLISVTGPYAKVTKMHGKHGVVLMGAKKVSHYGRKIVLR